MDEGGLVPKGEVNLFCFLIEDLPMEIDALNKPDEFVSMWLDESLNEVDRAKFRHVPKSEKEVQFFCVSVSNRRWPLAYGSLEKLNDEECVFGCAVSSIWQNLGIGKRMYQYAVDLAKKRGFKKITAEQDAGNIAAMKLCLELGFKFYGPVYHLEKIL